MEDYGRRPVSNQVWDGDLGNNPDESLATGTAGAYATVEQFSETWRTTDIAAYSARKGDTWYQTRKFLRRHWLPVTAAALAMAGLSPERLWPINSESLHSGDLWRCVNWLTRLFDIDAAVRQLPGSNKDQTVDCGYLSKFTCGRLSQDADTEPELL